MLLPHNGFSKIKVFLKGICFALLQLKSNQFCTKEILIELSILIARITPIQT